MKNYREHNKSCIHFTLGSLKEQIIICYIFTVIISAVMSDVFMHSLFIKKIVCTKVEHR